MSADLRHRLDSGVDVDFERLVGTVIDQREQTVMHLTQGTQWYMDGSSTPGRISSSTEEIRKAWLRMADGKERLFDFSDLGVEARPGHELSLVFAAAPGMERKLVVVHNRATNMVHSLRIGGVDSANNDAARALFLPGRFRRESLVFAAVGAAALLLAVVNDRNGGLYQDLQAIFFGSIAGFIVWIFALLFRLSPARRLELRTYPEIESVAAQYAEAK